MPDNNLGVLNSNWGVCGFTSSLYGLWDVMPARRALLQEGTKAHRLLAEIKTYLVTLKAEGNHGLITDIERFCQAFGEPFNTFTIDKYIARVNESVTKSEDEIKNDINFGIGLPPQAVVEYLANMWEQNTSLTTGNAVDNSSNGIIGVKNVNKLLSDLHDGLEHYMYRYNNKIYSWGDEFNSVDHAAKMGAEKGTKWEVCCVISFV